MQNRVCWLHRHTATGPFQVRFQLLALPLMGDLFVVAEWVSTKQIALRMIMRSNTSRSTAAHPCAGNHLLLCASIAASTRVAKAMPRNPQVKWPSACAAARASSCHQPHPAGAAAVPHESMPARQPARRYSRQWRRCRWGRACALRASASASSVPDPARTLLVPATLANSQLQLWCRDSPATLSGPQNTCGKARQPSSPDPRSCWCGAPVAT